MKYAENTNQICIRCGGHYEFYDENAKCPYCKKQLIRCVDKRSDEDKQKQEPKFWNNI